MDYSAPAPSWNPTKFRRFERLVKSSTSPAIVMTDAGRAYAKVMGNPEGPHVLACELVGMNMAAMLGLKTLDHAILELERSDVFPLANGQECEIGPAFVTRAINARSWSGTDEELDLLVNPDDIGRLVVLDTWLLNPDRMARFPIYPNPPHSAARDRKPNLDNVLLETPHDQSADKVALVAMDFSHAITSGRDLTREIDSIVRVRDEGVYGLFDQFRRFVREEVVEEMADRLRGVTKEGICAVLARIPEAWEVRQEAREALQRFLLQRGSWLADTILPRLAPLCWDHVNLPLWERGELR